MEKKFLEDCLRRGYSLERIGAIVDRHPSTVGYWLKKHGLSPSHPEHAPKGGIERDALEALSAGAFRFVRSPPGSAAGRRRLTTGSAATGSRRSERDSARFPAVVALTESSGTAESTGRPPSRGWAPQATIGASAAGLNA
jgi:hypothetical protein